jgi:hypothetical protein
MGVITTGFHRIGNVTTRASFGLEQQVVPGATIFVTSTASGTAATIYYDPGLSVAISGSILTADIYGNYSYYMPMNYCVTETISAPQGSLSTTVNISSPGPLVASLTTTSATTDVVTVSGCTANCHVVMQPTNSAAATMCGSTYVSAKSANSITVTHPGTSGATFDIIVTPY